MRAFSLLTPCAGPPHRPHTHTPIRMHACAQGQNPGSPGSAGGQGAHGEAGRSLPQAGPGEASLLSHRGGGDAAASQVMESFYSGFGRGLGKYWDHFSWGNVPGGFLVGVPKEPMSFPWPPRGGGECSLQLQALFTATHDGHHWSVQAQAPPPVDKAVGLSRTLPSKAPP